MIDYLTGIAALLSQFLHKVLFNGHHDMTISARCYVDRRKPGWRLGYMGLNSIFFWQSDHCHESFARDIEYAIDVLAIAERERAG